MKKTFKIFMAAVSCFALTGFLAACSGGSKGTNDSTAVETEATEEVQQTPFQKAAAIVKDLPKNHEEMTEAQRKAFEEQAQPLCDETNGKPAEIEVAPGLDITLTNIRYEDWRAGDNSIQVMIKADFDKSVEDYYMLCLDKDNKVVFYNSLTFADKSHKFVSGWVAPENAEKWGSVVRLVLVSAEVGKPLSTGDTYNQ